MLNGKELKSCTGLTFLVDLQRFLSDFPHANYRGAPLDGRPRTSNESGAFEHFKSAYFTCHPKKNNLRIKSHVSVDRPQKEIVFRLVMIQGNKRRNTIMFPMEVICVQVFLQESIWITLLGIIQVSQIQ